ncbi:MAG: hypothetical protein R3E62_07450 [Pseudomonadales bacterium]|jgi:hypothetical protein
MNRNKKLVAWVAGLGLSLAALSAQAGNVGFSITYSDYDHHRKSTYYSYGHPSSLSVHYSDRPYHSKKYYRNDHRYKRHHNDWYNYGHDFERRHYKKHHKLKEYNYHSYKDAYWYNNNRKHYGGHFHGNAYCNIRH